jgi:glycosyltransferase involved in cell wall biosynthesis
MIYKVLVGNEHGGAAMSSEEIVNFFLKEKDDFRVVFLTNDRFAKHFNSAKTSNLNSFVPPRITTSNFVLKLVNSFKFLFWIFYTSFKFLSFAKKNKVKYVHTTNNHALLICLLCKIFYPEMFIISHWRCVGLASASSYVFLLHKINKVISISEAVQQSLPEFLQKKSVVIYNGVDVARLNSMASLNKGKLRSLLGVDDEVFLIGTIGSYTTIKCHDLIIDTVEKLNNPSVLAVLFGSTPNGDSKEYLTYLKDKVKEKNLQKNVIFVDNKMVSKPKMMISDLDLFIGATWNDGLGEGFGLIYVEAMAQQLPVIAIDVGAAKEIVVDGETGSLMAKNSSSLLKMEIEKCMMSKQLKELGQNGYERALNMFSIDKTLMKVNDLYKSVVINNK